MLPVDETARFLSHLRDLIGRTAEAMPRHEEYIAQHCSAHAVAA
jgi:tryptophan halogenase